MEQVSWNKWCRCLSYERQCIHGAAPSSALYPPLKERRTSQLMSGRSFQHSSPNRHGGQALASQVSLAAPANKLRSFLEQKAEVLAARVRGRRTTPGSLLLHSFRAWDVGCKNECTFEEFSKCVDSTVPWPDVQQLWELWNNFFDRFCAEQMVPSPKHCNLRYLLFIVHHFGQDGLTIADVASISQETQKQLTLIKSAPCNGGSTESTFVKEISDGLTIHSASSAALPAVPLVITEGLRSIMSAVLSSSFSASFDRYRTSNLSKNSRIIMQSSGLLHEIADKLLKSEGTVSVLLLAALLKEADVSRCGTVPLELLCQIMRLFQVTLILTDQKSQALIQFLSCPEGDAADFSKQVHAATPIYYKKLLAHVRGTLPNLRQQKLCQLFHVLDNGNKGFLSVEDISSALQYTLVSAQEIRNLGHATAILECSRRLMTLIISASFDSQCESQVQESVSISAFVDFYHALSSSISRNAAFFAVLYKMWERGVENPGDMLDCSNINFRPSKVFDAVPIATASDTCQNADTALAKHQKSRQLFADSEISVESPAKTKLLSNQGSSTPTHHDGFVSRLQSPKFLDETNFSSRKATPRVTAFDGAAGVTSASGTNSRIHSHLSRGSNNLPLHYDAEIDGFTAVRRKLVSSSAAGEQLVDPLLRDGDAPCGGLFARIRGLLRQEHVTNMYKSSHQSSLSNLNPMKFVSRWNNFIWLAANVILEDARKCSTTAASVSSGRSPCIQGFVTVEGFSGALDDTCIHLTESELMLLEREYHRGQACCIAYPELLMALVSLTNHSRESRKITLWQELENASGFRGRMPFANVFRAMKVAGHPLVANHMCDAGTMADTLLRLFLISAAIVDGRNLLTSTAQASNPQLLSITSAEIIRVLHSAATSITNACGRSGAAAFNAIAGDEILSRCSMNLEAFGIVVDVLAFFAGDEQALELELWGLWQRVDLMAKQQSSTSRPLSGR